MTPAQEPPTGETVAQQSADRLALALEEVGFDVGMEFPMLCGTQDSHGAPVVALGRVAEKTAFRLSTALYRAAEQGVNIGDLPTPE